MEYYADLHIHSRYSRATSRDCDLEHLSFWAQKKGIRVIGTGDFTHPGWLSELKEKLVTAEPGLYRLRSEDRTEPRFHLPARCQAPVRFMLSSEISTIYKKGDRTRKVHHCLFAPDFQSVDRIIQRLSRIGNLHADGRPILGLDSRHLLEIVLEAGPGCFLIPAHIWTPWFSVLGSNSGFDAIEDCYGDLSEQVFALETGLSSDPPMNWRVSALDRYRLVSNSDAHSPQNLGREACVFHSDLDYFAMRRALEHGHGYVGTVEFYPEEGKYHLDGHRKCGVRLTPSETRKYQGRCPVCGKEVTVGVMHRVEELSDRPDGTRSPTAGEVRSLIPLAEIVAEIMGVGSKSRCVGRVYDSLLARLGPELFILNQAPLDRIDREASGVLAEAIARLRQGKVIRKAGYDGEYGVIRLFLPDELRSRTKGGLLFESDEVSSSACLPGAEAGGEETDEGDLWSSGETGPESSPGRPLPHRSERRGQIVPSPYPDLFDQSAPTSEILVRLDTEQRAAAEVIEGPLLILAGPGSGKTRTLTHRIAHLVADCGIPPRACLAITFTRRAAGEMQDRLQGLLPGIWQEIAVHTFHGFGYRVLKDHGDVVGLKRTFGVASEAQRIELLRVSLDLTERKARRLLEDLSVAKRSGEERRSPEIEEACRSYDLALRAADLVDYDDLVWLASTVLESDLALLAEYRERCRWISIDEYQDVDPAQYRLVRLLAPPLSNLCVIGDPDQAIYGFRGADVRFFHRFREDYPTAREVNLTRNYRSGRAIVQASGQVMSLAGEKRVRMEAMGESLERIVVHEAPSAAAEAEFVVHTIERLLGGHTFFSFDSGRLEDSPGEAVVSPNLSFADFAVLYRTEALADPLGEAFARSGMPFQRRSHGPLRAHPGVQVIERELRTRGLEGSILACLAVAGELCLQSAGSDSSGVAASDIQEALEVLGPLARTCGDDLSRFQALVATGSLVDTWDPRAEAVSLLTIHAAKGLEFRVVFLVGCEDGILPLRWGGSDRTGLEEERRVFYVGMTRAKDQLFLCRSARRAWRGGVHQTSPSPFLQEIEEALLERRAARERQKREKEGGGQLTLF